MQTMLRVVFVLCYVAGSMADDGPVVETSLGKIKGSYKKSFEGRLYSAFEGIPYAKPPVGHLRFEPPQPVSPWSYVLNANVNYMCKQSSHHYALAGRNDSEDCLYLNVHVPKTIPSKYDNFDVIVNIHGGAFMIGSSSFAGPYFLMDRDIVYVNLNYRLGILGFLSTEDSVVPGNNGLKDQQMVLKWVQSHIRDFGGNPKSVTLMGLSAGGASVHFHYFSPQSRGLFHRGISQSGNAIMSWAIQENALKKTHKLAESLNCQNSNLQALINCLKAVQVDDLVKESKSFYDLFQFPLAPFAPVVEVPSNSSFLIKHPFHQLEDGDVYDVPWLHSITKDEGLIGTIQLDKMLDTVDNNWNEWSEHLFDYKHVCTEAKKKEVAEKIKSFYLKNDKLSPESIKSLNEIFSDRLFKVGFETALEMQSKVSSSSIYAAIYGYDKLEDIKRLMGIELDGVVHGADGFLVHAITGSERAVRLSQSDILMKNVLIDFITSFAKDSIPKSSQVRWEPFTPTDPKYLLINDYNDLNMKTISKLSPKDFWNSLDFTENSQFKRTTNSVARSFAGYKIWLACFCFLNVFLTF